MASQQARTPKVKGKPKGEGRVTWAEGREGRNVLAFLEIWVWIAQYSKEPRLAANRVQASSEEKDNR